MGFSGSDIVKIQEVPRLPTKRLRSVPRSTGRIPALDGVRGFAISLVLCWHGFFSGTSVTLNLPQTAHLDRIGRLTWSGVDLFFVLSGFLIGGILLDTRATERYYSTFYARRAYRILPLYVAVVLLALSLSAWAHGHGLSDFWARNDIPRWYYPMFIQNLWMARHGIFGSYTLGLTWSLAIEEQFYLTLPFIVRHVSRLRLWWIIGGMIVGAPLLRVVLVQSFAKGSFASYVLMPCRADALGLGIAAALVWRSPDAWVKICQQRLYLYAALSALIITVFFVLSSSFVPFSREAFGLEYSLLALLYFVLLLGVLVSKTMSKAFSVKALRYMGTIAYGLYLLHFPIMAAVHDMVAGMHPRRSLWIAPVTALCGIGLAILVAGLSWEHFEKPLLARGRRHSYERQLVERVEP